MEKIFRSRTKAEEKEDNEIFKNVENQLSPVRENLKLLFWNGGKKDISEDGIYSAIKCLDQVKSTLFSYLFDGEVARISLKEHNKNLQK